MSLFLLFVENVFFNLFYFFLFVGFYLYIKSFIYFDCILSIPPGPTRFFLHPPKQYHLYPC